MENIPFREKAVKAIRAAALSIAENAEEYATKIPNMSDLSIEIRFDWESLPKITLMSNYVVFIKDGENVE